MKLRAGIQEMWIKLISKRGRSAVGFFIIFFVSFMLLGFGSQAAVTTHEAALRAIKSTTLPDARLQIQLQFSKTPSVKPLTFATHNPERIILDFKGVNNRLTQSLPQEGVGIIQGVTALEANGRTRIIFDLRKASNFQWQFANNNLLMTLDPGSALGAAVASNLPQAKTAGVTNRHQITGVNFRKGQGDAGEIVVDLADTDTGIDLREDKGQLIVNFMNTQLPDKAQRHINVAGYKTPAQTIDLNPTGNNIQMVVTGNGDYQHLGYQINKQFIIEIKPSAASEQAMPQAAQAASIPSNSQAGDQTKANGYSGARLSLNFQDIKVRAVLQLIAEFTGLNIVTSDSVKSSITLHLQNVPWDQALDIILRTQGLDKRKMGNVILIAPADEIAAREKQDLLAQQQVENLVPLSSELIQINYGKAADIATLLKDKGNSVLSARGNVSVDARTNTLWVQDAAEKIGEIKSLVHKLDVPVKQVLIEARIVNVNSDFERDLGIRWGITDPVNLTGTYAGASQMVNGTAPAALTDPTQRLNVNLAANTSSLGSTPASIGIALAKLNGELFLDMELSALEKEGRGQIISNPRLVTANQQAASIESGEEIPYQEATSSGATNISFKKAVLSLNVTPQITPDGKIILNLKVNQDSRGVVTNGVPAINTRAIETQVLVDNGETVVLGGIYEQTNSKQLIRVPFLGTLPVVGSLFRQNQEVNNRKELLIFVTPKIIRQTPFASSSAGKN